MVRLFVRMVRWFEWFDGSEMVRYHSLVNGSISDPQRFFKRSKRFKRFKGFKRFKRKNVDDRRRKSQKIEKYRKTTRKRQI